MSCHLRRVYVPSYPSCAYVPIPSWCAFVPPPQCCAYVPTPLVVCLRATPLACLRTALPCAFMPQNLEIFKPINQSVILSSRYFFSILQQRCLSKASCRRQRIMADYIVVKISSPTHHGTPPQMLTKPGDACHRCSLMSQVQEPFSNVAIFLVVGFGCCER
jgi:hypothetical protein